MVAESSNSTVVMRSASLPQNFADVGRFEPDVDCFRSSGSLQSGT